MSLLMSCADEPSDSWRDRAACRDSGPNLFFPAGPAASSRHVERAKSVCKWCPVRCDCLDYALETNQQPGIWGGLDEAERRKLRRKLQVQNRAGGSPAGPSRGGSARARMAGSE